MNFAVKSLALALLVLASNPGSASPTLDTPLTDRNALDDEHVEHVEGHFVVGDGFQRLDNHRMAVDVADALVKGLEDSIEGKALVL